MQVSDKFIDDLTEKIYLKVKARFDFTDDKKTKNLKVNSILYELYQLIYIEVCHTSINNESFIFAKKLLPYMSKLNDILKFKK